MSPFDSSYSPRRFLVAFSFAGEIRDYVEKVAHILAANYSKKHIFYDKFHRAELSTVDMGFRLAQIYREDSDLVVLMICRDYDQKRWTGWEFHHIYDTYSIKESHRLMLCRFDKVVIKGLSDNAGYIELDELTPEQTAALITERLELNSNRSKQLGRQTPELGLRIESVDPDTAKADGSLSEPVLIETVPGEREAETKIAEDTIRSTFDSALDIDVMPMAETDVDVWSIMRNFFGFVLLLVLFIWLWRNLKI